jgi:hypothetical protein
MSVRALCEPWARAHHANPIEGTDLGGRVTRVDPAHDAIVDDHQSEVAHLQYARTHTHDVPAAAWH